MCDSMNPVSEIGLNALCLEVAYAYLVVTVLLENVDFTSIPVHIRGGVILPLRKQGTMTTTELRGTDFELVVAPGTNDEASGSLYIDDGVSVSPNATTVVTMAFKDGALSVQGDFGYPTGVDIARVRFLNTQKEPRNVKINGKTASGQAVSFNATSKVLDVVIGLPFQSNLAVHVE